MKILEITNREVRSIEPLLCNSAFKPYRSIADGIEKEIDQFWMNRIVQAMEACTTKAFMAELRHEPVGFLSVSDLPWDSKTFEIPMASVTEFVVNPNCGAQYEIGRSLMGKAVSWAKQSGYKFLLFKTYSDDLISIHVAEDAGFFLVDTLLDYTVDFRKTPFDAVPVQNPSDDVVIRFAGPDDERELVALAEDSFQDHFGRYHSDPKFSKEQAVRVYMEWMRSSLAGYADCFVLAEIEGRIAGLSVWKKPTDAEKNVPIRISHYSIGAIHPDFFGRKLFTLLTYEGMKIFQGQTDIIEGPTHINNYPVQRGYARLKWDIYDARHSFHKWLE